MSKSDNDEKRPETADVLDIEQEDPIKLEDDYDEDDFDSNEDSQPLSSRDTSSLPSDDEVEQYEVAQGNNEVTSRKRLILLVFLAALLWIGFLLRRSWQESKKPKIIYASRYSKEHKFRPAASPIITETLKDGRIRLRGALPEPTNPPKPVVKPKKKKARSGKLSGKKKAARQVKRKIGTADKRM
ncbi:hypothetical protein JR316_0010304 [Psilocybe cubensis]|uniref:Uncharacterized protein n=2 Tax=Psilocybe cubensis TaxID=181762 RepID=A0ACB8GRM8_PSICU|nr:hypothetical protein JR316_0010304 [Psilocybe cubensis]KAH9478067.1 hypothetical protein JR316_0010304 [Psilocybe cubensis]